MPELQALHKDFVSRGVKVIGATWKENGDPAKFTRDNGVTYDIVDGSSIGEAYGMNSYGLPTVYVIDAQGQVADYSCGYRSGWSEKWLRETVEGLLSGGE